MPLDFRKDNRYGHLTSEQIVKHYEIERRLAEKIMTAAPEARASLAQWAYDELFRQVPWHPALSEKSGITAAEVIERKKKIFLPLLPSIPAKILEIGCGMGELTFGLTQMGYDAFGLDISDARMGRLKTKSNNFVRANAVHLPFAKESFNAIVSQQLFEHLHPEDACVHLQEVHRVLKKRCCYILETPNKLTGPGDVSRFFVDGEAKGFHLKEYKIADIIPLIKNYGFSEISVILRKKRHCTERIALYLENIWGLLPRTFRLNHTLGLDNPIYIAVKD